MTLDLSPSASVNRIIRTRVIDIIVSQSEKHFEVTTPILIVLTIQRTGKLRDIGRRGTGEGMAAAKEGRDMGAGTVKMAGIQNENATGRHETGYE